MSSSAVSRRHFLALSAAGMACLPARAFAQTVCDRIEPTILQPRIQRAVSLRQVIQKLADGNPVKFPGLTRLDGYVIDEENDDIGLIGLAEPGQRDLEAADFVVALRSAFLRGMHDGVNYDFSAAISIDPNPEVFRRLRDIRTTNPDGRHSYEDVCRAPQTVRVDGMIRASRVAALLVDADYRMKQVSQGALKLPTSKPIVGDFDARIAIWRSQLDAKGASDLVANITRYWFTPGQFGYIASEDGADTIYLDRAQVLLKDEAEVLTAGASKTVASGSIDTYARAFTCAWTASMEETYRAEPIWRELYNMYRHFAVARIMAETGAFNRVKLDIAFLLDRYKVPNVNLPASLPGLSRIVTHSTKRRSTTWNAAYAVCGGVQVGLSKVAKSGDSDGNVQRTGQNVLSSRPSRDTLAWNVVPGSLKSVFKKKPAPDAGASSERAAPAGTGSIKDLFPPVTTEKPIAAPSLRELFRT
ncbi:DUF1598 domain-containing protein [Bradyrhizobium sp. YR681]|uniref:DUF1598 domain-containing protein n=1 Tax=Bradyrhizobium sp. YR681 TaxID=1144344 RepID=UPI0012F69765|nr:DUF1598 domain-containing protein [Bradyrhizobium sp. YR681]